MNTNPIPIAVFRLGKIVTTIGASQSIPKEEILKGIQRHQAGDWGELEADNWEANDRALTRGSRIVSAYNATNGTRFWIITESDRSVTTVLLPQEY